MAMVSLDYIDVDEKGIARLAGRRTKVIQIVMDKLAYGWGPEEIQEQHPHLSLAQIHAAFAYYYEHKKELDKQIAEYDRYSEEMRAQAGESPIVQKLRALGKIP